MVTEVQTAFLEALERYEQSRSPWPKMYAFALLHIARGIYPEMSERDFDACFREFIEGVEGKPNKYSVCEGSDIFFKKKQS